MKFKDTLRHYNTVKKYAELDLLTTEYIWIVSDGGLAHTQGYYGWVIATDTDILYEGRGRVPSKPSHLDSLRSESMGMYHTIFIMSSLLHKHNLTQEINLSSDNLELIKRTK